MVTFGKCQEENTKQDHEKYHLIADCDKHCCQEIQLLEYPYKVNYLDERHDYTEAKQDFHQVCGVIIEKVKSCSPVKEEHSCNFEVIPEVFPVLRALIFDLSKLVNEEYKLYNWTYSFPHEELDTFDPNPIFIRVVETLQIDIVNHKEDKVQYKLVKKECVPVCVPLVIYDVLDSLLLK